MNSRIVRSVSFVSSCLLLAFSTQIIPAHADDSPPNSLPIAGAEPLRCTSLAQTAESEVQDIKLSIVDGKLHVTGSMTFPTPIGGVNTTDETDSINSKGATSLANGGITQRPHPIQPIQPIGIERAGGVEWSIDPHACTYTLKRRPVSKEFETDMGKAAATQQAAHNPTMQSYNYNRAGFRVTTRDPIYIPVAATTVVGFWTSDDYNVYHNWTYLDCWGANPTALNTHWYSDSCSGGGYPWQPSPYSLCYSASGSYYNFDGPPGGSPYESTGAMHYVNFCTYGPWVSSVNFSYWHWGEAWWLLSGWLEWA